MVTLNSTIRIDTSNEEIIKFQGMLAEVIALPTRRNPKYKVKLLLKGSQEHTIELLEKDMAQTLC